MSIQSTVGHMGAGKSFTDSAITTDDFHKYFYTKYASPLQSHMWIANAFGIWALYVENVKLRLHPDIQIEYLGNPKFGKPPRTAVMRNNFIGEASLTFLDDSDNVNINSLLEKFLSRHNASYAQAVDNTTTSDISLTRYTNPQIIGGNEAVPVMNFNLTHCSIMDIKLGQISKSANDFRKIEVSVHIGGVQVNRETKFGVLEKKGTDTTLDESINRYKVNV